MDEKKFWARVRRAGDSCWLWQGSLKGKGYGALRWRGRHRGAHVVAYGLTHGFPPPGMFVLHTCDTPACCNPAHLFLGTNATNMIDARNKGRVANQRLTWALVRSIRGKRARGWRLKRLARHFGISAAYCSQLVTNRAWYDPAYKPRRLGSLTAKQKREVKRLYAPGGSWQRGAGKSARELAQMFNTSIGTIYGVLNAK